MVERAKSRKGVGQKPKCRSRCFFKPININYMQTIKQIASQISNENLISSEIEDLLKKYLNWINVEHEMPELGAEVLIKKTIELGGTNKKIVTTNAKCILNQFTGKPWFLDLQFTGNGVVTHWKPILYV